MLWSMSVRECGMVLSVGESEMNHVKGNVNNKIDNNRNDNVNNNTINNTTKKIIKKRIDKIKLFKPFFALTDVSFNCFIKEKIVNFSNFIV
jgi:hypothetical protein